MNSIVINSLVIYAKAFTVVLSLLGLFACSGSDEGASPDGIVGDVALGQSLYLKNCQNCHGSDGKTPFPLYLDNALDYTRMHTTTVTRMPKADPTQCDDTCATHVVAFIRDKIFPNGLPLPENLRRHPLAARLVKVQYINALQDILSVELNDTETSLIPKETRANEKDFVTARDAQGLDIGHIRAYAKVARSLTERLDVNALAREHVNCATADDSCRNSLVDYFGLRFHRRPLTTIERNNYRNTFSAVVAISGTNVGHAVRALLRSMMQSPVFLYQSVNEVAGANLTRELDGYELAARLSFFIWLSTPDDELYQFAEQVQQNGLTQNLLEQQVNRLLADVKAKRSQRVFWSDYSLSSNSPIEIAAANKAQQLRESVVQTFIDLSASGESLQNIFTQTSWQLTPELAQDLGLSSAGPGLQSYDVSTLPQRTGLLAHPGFIANIGSISFVGRGVFLTERVLCRGIGDIPEGIQEQINDTADVTRDLTPRQAKDYRFGLGGACKACHSTFEPIAFAFEQLDVLGNYTAVDGRQRDLFSHGYLQNADGSEGANYNDVSGLMAILQASEEASTCFVSNMFSFGSGRNFIAKDKIAIEQAYQKFTAEGKSFTALQKAIALSPLMRTIEKDTAQVRQ